MRFPGVTTHALAYVLVLVVITSSDAFTSLRARKEFNRHRVYSPSDVSLYALKGQQLLPPPPPPSTTIPGNPLNDADFLEHTLQNARNSLASLHLPNLASLREQGSVNVESLRESLSSLSFLDVSALKEQVVAIQYQWDALDADLVNKFQNVAENPNLDMLTANPGVKPIVEQISILLQPLFHSPTLAMAGSAVITFVLVNSILGNGRGPPPTQPYPLNKYDPTAARLYFDQRLPMVVARGLEIFVQSLTFGLSLLRDKLDDKIAVNEQQRGRELAALLTRLGPTFIKVGQSLSIRTDLLSPGYIRGLETLQDQVPHFPTEVAQQILEREWGQPISAVLVDDLSELPIAAAS